MKRLHLLRPMALVALFSVVLFGCSQTEIVESPRTGFAVAAGEPKEPTIVWTSRTLDVPFDYLGQIKVRSWTYDGALERMTEAAKELRADAIIDVHYQTVGFMTSFQAFAVKYK